MKKDKIIRMICNILLFILLPCFILATCWYFTGSLEMFPTAEQEGKAKLSAILLMMISGIPCVICIITRIKYRRSANKETTSDGCIKR